MMASILLQVACSFLVWLLLYRSFGCWNKHRTPEWSCRLVTLAHGVVVTFLSGYIVLIDGPWPLTHTGYPNTTLQAGLMCLTLGYFIFDLSWCIYFNSEGILMLLHHALSICGTVIVLALGQSATEVNAVVFVSEITNPLLQLRWFLRDMGCYHSLVGDVVDFLFIALFLTLRIVAGAWIVHSVALSSRTILTLKWGVLAMYLVSLGFLLDILHFARRKMLQKYCTWKSKNPGGELPASNGYLPAR
ncbi:hypothetical protein lerEdw1_007587 [Lerista edwardsae]|nr:hypothetical protein lerEdw1_007587 [Lerista edwardsae]